MGPYSWGSTGGGVLRRRGVQGEKAYRGQRVIQWRGAHRGVYIGGAYRGGVQRKGVQGGV